MSKKSEAEYQEWIKEVESKLSDEKKANFKALVDDPAGKEIFGGHMREKFFYQSLNDVTAQKREVEQERAKVAQDVAALQAWLSEEGPKNERLIAERDSLKRENAAALERLEELGGAEDFSNLSEGKRKRASDGDVEALRKEIQALRFQQAMIDQALPAMLGDYGVVLREAAKENLDVDPRALVAYSTQKSVTLPEALKVLTADQREKREQERFAKEIEKAKEEGRREALSSRGSPEAMRPSGPTVIDNLQKSSDMNGQQRVNSAVQHYLEISR